MKIGIDARQLTADKPAGVSTYLRTILRFFAEFDEVNEFVLYAHHDIDDAYLLNERFSKRIIPGKVGSFWLRHKIPQILAQDGIDVFWGPEHVLPKRNGTTRYVLTVHDLGLLIDPSWGQWYNAIIQNVFLTASVKDADAIIAISDSTKRDIERFCPSCDAPITVVYNGATQGMLTSESMDVAQTLATYGIRGPYLLYVGTIEPRKNIETMVAAFNLVRAQRDAQLVLVGKLGWRYKQILKAIESSPYHEDIIQTGYVSNEDKDALYAASAGFVFPSHYEGFGIPIIEAMAKGVPVITARNSSLEEVGGDAAYYIDDENNAQDLAAAMLQFLDLTEEDRRQMIPGLVRNAARFTWEECARQTYDVIVGQAE